MTYHVIYTGEKNSENIKPKCFTCTNIKMFESTLASKNDKHYLSFLISAIIPSKVGLSSVKARSILTAANITGTVNDIDIESQENITTADIDKAITNDIDSLFNYAQNNEDLQKYISEMLLRHHGAMLVNSGFPFAGFTTKDNTDIENINKNLDQNMQYYEHDISPDYACFSREKDNNAPSTKMLLDALIRNTQLNKNTP